MAVENMDLLERMEAAAGRGPPRQGFPRGWSWASPARPPSAPTCSSAAEESIRNTEWTTVALVVLILLVVYRAPGLVIVPLVAIFASLELSTGLIALLARLGQRRRLVRLQGLPHHEDLHRRGPLRRARPTTACSSSRAIGRNCSVGCRRGRPCAAALASVGAAVAASAMTTILGLGTMIFADFGKFRYGGPTIALSLAVALLACLTLAPALLRAGGRIVFWPFGIGTAQPTPTRTTPPSIVGRVWQAIGQAVVDPAGTDLRRLPAACWPGRPTRASRCRSPTTWWRS